MINNALIIVVEGIATALLLLLTLFASMTHTGSGAPVWLTYLVTVGFLGWRAQQQTPGSGPAGPLGGLRRVMGRALIVSALGCVVSVGGSLMASIRPSQESLATRFRDHRAEYEELRDWAIKGSPMPVPDCASLGCPTLRPDESVWFPVGSWGMANNGWRLSLVWTRNTPGPLIPTLDGFQRTSTSRAQWDTAFSRIEGNWYLAIVW